MSFKELMHENGYELKTTFWDDFSIADMFGERNIRDTYNRAFDGWKDNYIYLTELVMVLNHKIWQHYESNQEIAALYDELWRFADNYAMENLMGDELNYFCQVTD